jgi:2-amino-4-hydroxy-6-hydroxymethyldihydropteridine diphosphokinase
MRCFIGLGSNLADPKYQVSSAIEQLKQVDKTRFIQSSSLYSSPPMGPQDQPDYVNAVLEIETELSAHGLLDKLQEIERIHGRVRKRHWGERTLDLDLLLYGDIVIDDERLKVPHPGIAERAFVLYPLAEIAPEITIPKLGLVSTLKQHCPPAGLDKME